MAALQLREDKDAGRLILQPALASRLGGCVFGLIWLVGVGVFLVPMLGGGRVDWFAIGAFLLFAFVPMSASFFNAIFATMVTIDRSTRTLTSVRSLLFLPIGTTTVAFNDLTKIEVQYVSRSSAVNVWLVNAVSRNNNRLRLNWNGAQLEMVKLAEQVSAITGVPVVQAEYAMPATLQDVLKKIAPTVSDQAEPSQSAPAPQSTEPEQTSTVLGRLLRDIADQATPEDASQQGAPAPNVLSPNELAQMPEPDVVSVPEAEAEGGKPVLNLPTNQLEQRVAADSMDSDARYALARRYHARGDLERAIALYSEVVRIDPTNPNAQNDLGIALQQRGRRAEAETAYRRAIALDPFSSIAHLNLALFLRALNRATEASQEFFLARQNARGGEETRAAEAASSGAKMDSQLSRT